MKQLYYGILSGISIIGGVLGQLLGGWDIALQVLVFFMCADYFTGILCALVWKKSPKSEKGAFESNASIKGLIRKCAILLFIMVACKLDEFSGTEFIRTATITFFIANEGFSLVENLGIMGIPMPKAVKNAFDLLKEKDDIPTDKE